MKCYQEEKRERVVIPLSCYIYVYHKVSNCIIVLPYSSTSIEMPCLFIVFVHVSGFHSILWYIHYGKLHLTWFSIDWFNGV